MDSGQSSNAQQLTITQSWNWRITERPQHSLSTTYIWVLYIYEYVYMCNSCSSEVVGQLEEHNSKGTIESLGSSEDTDTGTIQFQASIHIHAIMSCPLFSACFSTFCCTTCLSGRDLILTWGYITTHACTVQTRTLWLSSTQSRFN